MTASKLIKPEGNSYNEMLLEEEHKLYYSGKDVDFQSTYRTADGNMEWKDPTTSVSKFNEITACLDLTGKRTFLDCGCGLGHVLYLASKLFENVIGVEIIEEAAEQCRKNLTELIPDNNIPVVTGDLFDLNKEVIDRVDVFYVSCPFDKESDFTRWRDIVDESIARKPRDAYFIYYYPIFAPAMKSSRHFTLEREIISNNGNVNIYRTHIV